MGFVSSFAIWLILSMIIAFLLFTVFFFILGWVYPLNRMTVQEGEINDDEQIHQSRRLVGIFILVAILIIMTISGINALMTMN